MACEVTVTDHADQHTPDSIASLCVGATCRTHGDLMDSEWHDRATAEAAANAHRQEHRMAATPHHVATIKVYSTDRDALLAEVENLQAFVAERDEESDVFTSTTIHPDTVDLEDADGDPDADVQRDLIRIDLSEKAVVGGFPGDMPGRPSVDEP